MKIEVKEINGVEYRNKVIIANPILGQLYIYLIWVRLQHFDQVIIETTKCEFLMKLITQGFLKVGAFDLKEEETELKNGKKTTYTLIKNQLLG